MSVRRGGTLAASLICAVVLLGPPAADASVATYGRMYLLSSPANYLYWSADPSDPELSQPLVTRDCGDTASVRNLTNTDHPCHTFFDGSTYWYGITFLPATRIDGPVTWSAANPLRFHLALHVGTPLGAPIDTSVILGFERSNGFFESAPATLVAPDVWEGTLPTGRGLEVDDPNLFDVEVSTKSPAVSLELKTGGASWVELPDPVPARPVTTLVAQNPESSAPSTYATPTHSFWFNDREWEVQSFAGDLSQERRFDVTLAEQPVAVMAWVEAYTNPFMHDVYRGRPPDTRKILDSPILTVSQDGKVLDRRGALLVGSTEVTVDGVHPGDLSVTVSPNGTLWPQSFPYNVYVLAVYGSRTLRSYDSTFSMDSVTEKLPVTATCPYSILGVPLTSDVSTFKIRLDWDNASPQDARWTLSFWLRHGAQYPCGEIGDGPEVRFTLPVGNEVWWVAPTPGNSNFVSSMDTVFTMHVDYAYTPPPEPA